MIAIRARTAGSVAIGMAGGYCAWLLAGLVIIAAIPVHRWAAAAALLVVAITAGCLLAARQNRVRRSIAVAPCCAPIPPVLASLYLLVAATS